jgi:RES domain
MARRRTPEEWAALASEQIVSYTSCCSVFEGDYVFDGDRTAVRDFLLWSMEVPENKVESVVTLLKCSNCHGSIDEWDDIEIKPAHEVEEDAAVEYASRRWGKKLTDFAAFLATYPMLGAAHPVGKRILQEIDKFRKVTLPEAVWFRGRRIDAAGRKLTPADLRVPDPTTVAIGIGRFNHHGQAHWYLAEQERSALEEVLDPGETLAWVQRWRVTEMADVLDLVLERRGFEFFESFLADEEAAAGVVGGARADELPVLALAMMWGQHLDRPVDRQAGWKPEYFVPLFVMDAAKYRGFRGIRYTSVHGGGINLVIFDRDAPVTNVGDPEIRELKDLAHDIPGFSDDDIIS